MTDLATWALTYGYPWPLPAPEPGKPDLLRESLEAAYVARQAEKDAYGPYGAEERT